MKDGSGNDDCTGTGTQYAHPHGHLRGDGRGIVNGSGRGSGDASGIGGRDVRGWAGGRPETGHGYGWGWENSSGCG